MDNTAEAHQGSGHPLLSSLPLKRVTKGKIVSAEEAVRVIRDGDTVATGGFVGIGFAEEIAVKLEEYFLETGRPRGLLSFTQPGGGTPWKERCRSPHF